MRYVVVYEETTSGWSAYVPDLRGCVASGDTREETEVLMREVIAMHLESMRDHGDPIPAPGSHTSLVEV